MNNNIYSKFLIFLIAAFNILNALAQERTITGKVTDSNTSDPLTGATVHILGTSTGTIADAEGNYTIEVTSENDVLVFAFIGYKKKEIKVNGSSVINVQLERDIKMLEEMVVIGYGTVRKSDLTGAVGSVKAEEILKITSPNPEQGLQGKVAGVQITSTSGTPGAIPTVRVRGVGTFNNSSPIFVVDGIILDDISFLNSADIESLEVLKDASATAIYGSRGANGVIIITTKSGEEGMDKPQFSYSGEYGFQQVAKKIDLLTGKEFGIISNEIKPGSYNNVDILPNTDWQDIIFDIAPIQNHQLSITGATKMSAYYVGIGYFNQKGIIEKSEFERFTIKLNNKYFLAKKFELGNNLTITPTKQRLAPNATYAVYRAQPLLEPYYDDGSFGVVHNVGNPLADIANSNNFKKGLRGVGNFYAQANLTEAISLRSSFGIDASYKKTENFTPAYTVYNPDGTATQQDNQLSDLVKEQKESLSWLWENTVSFNKRFGKNYLSAVAGYTMQRTSSEELKISGENILRDESDFWYISPAYILDPVNNINKLQDIENKVDPNLYFSMTSWLFRANYTYNDKYILTATFRRDGSSKFRKENRYSNFPSFAAGWNIGKEGFVNNIEILSKLKIRGSWGIIGNEKIAYFDRYARVQSDIIAVFGTPDASIPAASYGKSGNQELVWESTTQTDIGLEIGLFENKLSGEFDFYTRTTDDILVELSTPGHIGNGLGQKIRYNAASVLNRGIEFTVNWQETRNKFKYNITVLGSTIYNEVLAIGGSQGIDSILIGGHLGNGQPVTLSRVGLPIGSFYGYKTDGIFQNQSELDAYPHLSQAGIGDLRFEDVNGDSVLNGEDRTNIGSPIPKFIYGFSLGAEYKGFDLSIDFQGQIGNKIFNGKEVVRPDPYNFEKHVMERWTGEGSTNSEPRPSFGGYNYLPSDRFIQDGSFLRLRNVSLGYTLPSSITQDRIKTARIYIKGTNLFTWTKFTGYTPEIGSSDVSNGGDVLSNGIDKGIYPITKIYAIGINLIF